MVTGQAPGVFQHAVLADHKPAFAFPTKSDLRMTTRTRIRFWFSFLLKGAFF